MNAKVPQPEATTLSTAHLSSGRVSARIVYLKELDHRGFVIYSNWETSHKAKDIDSNPQAALTFWFRELERQVRVEGITERLTAEESQIYYDTRSVLKLPDFPSAPSQRPSAWPAGTDLKKKI